MNKPLRPLQAGRSSIDRLNPQGLVSETECFKGFSFQAEALERAYIRKVLGEDRD
jgi:hypothetical protein